MMQFNVELLIGLIILIPALAFLAIFYVILIRVQVEVLLKSLPERNSKYLKVGGVAAVLAFTTLLTYAMIFEIAIGVLVELLPYGPVTILYNDIGLTLIASFVIALGIVSHYVRTIFHE